jgi:hypothetical protein
MTMARAQRSDNFALALKTMLNTLGDAALDEVSFVASAHPDILMTTWDELLASELVETLLTGEHVLTGRGWTVAVMSTGQNNDPAFQHRIQKSFAALKGYVKGRHSSATVPFRDLVAQTQLPEGFLFNVIEGRYMEEVSKRRGASWVKPGRLVHIPVGFGIEHTDLRTLLDPGMIEKLEQLEEELDATRDHLSRYRCPYCDSELTSSGGYQIDEHNDGYFEEFACGYSLQDGSERGLCPQDPAYPKFEDFELRIEQSSSGQWMCFPIGKTPKAERVQLGSCPGRTREEAEQRVARRYEYISGKSRDVSRIVW